MKKYFSNILKCKFLFIQLFLFGKQCKVLLMKHPVDFFAHNNISWKIQFTSFFIRR